MTAELAQNWSWSDCLPMARCRKRNDPTIATRYMVYIVYLKRMA